MNKIKLLQIYKLMRSAMTSSFKVIFKSLVFDNKLISLQKVVGLLHYLLLRSYLKYSIENTIPPRIELNKEIFCRNYV